MSTLTYNGITLQMTDMNLFNQTAVYSEDGTDYLYTHFFIDCDCIFNPVATIDPALPPSFGMPGPSPTFSMASLRDRLMTAQQQLTLSFNNEVLLDSPQYSVPPAIIAAVGAAAAAAFKVSDGVDAKNGPHPVDCKVYEIHGVKTFKVKYIIETWVNEHPCNPSHPVASNRWVMRDTCEMPHFLTTRTIRGRAVFLKNILNRYWDENNVNYGYVPDDFRGAVIPPVQIGFQRQNVDVSASEDGTTLDYTIVDEEQTLCLNDGLGADVNNYLTKIEGDFTQVGDWYGTLLPSAYIAINIRAWGYKQSHRTQVIKRAYLAASTYGFFTDVPTRDAPFTKIEMRTDVVNKYAEVSMIKSCSILSSLWNKFFTAGFIIPLVNPLIIPDGLILADNGQPAGVTPTFCPNPFLDHGSRGFYAGSVFAASLAKPCTAVTVNPPSPGSPVTNYPSPPVFTGNVRGAWSNQNT